MWTLMASRCALLSATVSRNSNCASWASSLVPRRPRWAMSSSIFFCTVSSVHSTSSSSLAAIFFFFFLLILLPSESYSSSSSSSSSDSESSSSVSSAAGLSRSRCRPARVEASSLPILATSDCTDLALALDIVARCSRCDAIARASSRNTIPAHHRPGMCPLRALTHLVARRCIAGYDLPSTSAQSTFFHTTRARSTDGRSVDGPSRSSSSLSSPSSSSPSSSLSPPAPALGPSARRKWAASSRTESPIAPRSLAPCVSTTRTSSSSDESSPIAKRAETGPPTCTDDSLSLPLPLPEDSLSEPPQNLLMAFKG